METLIGFFPWWYINRSRQKIEFRCLDDLSHVIKTHSLDPHQPLHLCADEETLYYEDDSVNPYVIRTLPPGQVISIGLSGVDDMCVTEAGGKKLLIAVNWIQGVRAYDVRSGAEQWRVEGEQLLPGMEMEERFSPWGVTSNNQGHLFICDNKNHCIQMFRAADGRYMGKLEVDLEQYPRMILWSEKLSTLIITHYESCMEFIKIHPKSLSEEDLQL